MPVPTGILGFYLQGSALPDRSPREHLRENGSSVAGTRLTNSPHGFRVYPDRNRYATPWPKSARDSILDYWLERDRNGGFPLDFHAALARARLARHRDAAGNMAAPVSGSPKRR
jgi:hypothetical protein